MDDFLDALTDPDFCWFISDFSFAIESQVSSMATRLYPPPWPQG